MPTREAPDSCFAVMFGLFTSIVAEDVVRTETKREDSHGCASTDSGTFRRDKDPTVARAVRRCARAREKSARECASRAQVAGFGYAAAGGKRRPRRRPSWQGFGA